MDNNNECSHWFTHVFPKVIGRDVQVRMPGYVNKYNKSEHTATVMPLPLDSRGHKRAPIIAIVPSSIWQTDKSFQILEKNPRNDFHGYKPLQHGSIVSVCTFDREIDNMHGSSNYKLRTNRMHSFNDAIVTEVIKP